MKTEAEITEKCNKVIDFLDDCSLEEKVRITSNLYHSLIDSCKAAGLDVVEIIKGKEQ